MISKKENRQEIEMLLTPQRERLGERFDDFVNEINEVNYEYMLKKDQLPKYPVGVLDANSVEQRRLAREEGLKWVLIKQKYGI